QRAVAPAARHAGLVHIGTRLPVRLADCGTEPHVHPRAAEAVSAGDVDRDLGSHAAVGARSDPGAAAALWRDGRVGVRAGDVRERTAGPGAGARAPAARPGAIVRTLEHAADRG